jgi:hypothetical protein
MVQYDVQRASIRKVTDHYTSSIPLCDHVRLATTMIE